MNKLSLFLVLFFVSILSLTCQKEAIVITDPEIEIDGPEIDWTTASDVVVTQSVLSELVQIVYYNALQSPYLSVINSEPSNITRVCIEENVFPLNSDGWFPKTYTLAFTENCDLNGSLLSGTIKVRFSAPMTAENMNFEITELVDFEINGYKVEIEENGFFLMLRENGQGGINSFKSNSNNLKISGLDERVVNVGFNWSSILFNELQTFYDQEGEAAFLDDKIEVNVFESHLETSGVSFTAKTITGFPLLYEGDCRWIKNGQMQIDESVISGGPLIATKVLNFAYDNDQCDNLVLATAGLESMVVESP